MPPPALPPNPLPPNPYSLPLHLSPLPSALSSSLSLPAAPISSLISLLPSHPFPFLLRYRPHLIPLSSSFSDSDARKVYEVYQRFDEQSLAKTKENLHNKIASLPDSTPAGTVSDLHSQLRAALTASSLSSLSSSLKLLNPSAAKTATLFDKERLSLSLSAGRSRPSPPYLAALLRSAGIPTPDPLPAQISEPALLYLLCAHLALSPAARALLRDSYLSLGELGVKYPPAPKGAPKRPPGHDPLGVLHLSGSRYGRVQGHSILKLHRLSEQGKLALAVSLPDFACAQLRRSLLSLAARELRVPQGDGASLSLLGAAASLAASPAKSSHEDPRTLAFIAAHPALLAKLSSLRKSSVAAAHAAHLDAAKTRAAEVLVENYRSLLRAAPRAGGAGGGWCSRWTRGSSRASSKWRGGRAKPLRRRVLKRRRVFLAETNRTR